jgi:hypothetical protein
VQDTAQANKRSLFFNMLKTKYNFEAQLFEIDFKGRRLRKQDRHARVFSMPRHIVSYSYCRHPNDPFEPKEKCVDIAMATDIVFHAAISDSFDIAVGTVIAIILVQYCNSLTSFN